MQEQQANQLSVDVYKAECWVLDGKSWSWKRMSYKPTNKFHPENVNYCQDFLSCMSTSDPYGINPLMKQASSCQMFRNLIMDMHIKVYCDCIEIGQHLYAPNITLQLLISLDGILFADIINDNTGAIEFLNFFKQAVDAWQPNGNPTMMFRDHVLLGNHSAHHRAIGLLLDNHWIHKLLIWFTHHFIHQS